MPSDYTEAFVQSSLRRFTIKSTAERSPKTLGFASGYRQCKSLPVLRFAFLVVLACFFSYLRVIASFTPDKCCA